MRNPYSRHKYREAWAAENNQFRRLATRRIHAPEVKCRNSVTPAGLTEKTARPMRIKVIKYKKPTHKRQVSKAPAFGHKARKKLSHIREACEGLERFSHAL